LSIAGQLDDLENLLKVRVDFLRDAKNIRDENDEKMVLGANREFLIKSLADGSFVQYLAIDKGKIVGTSSVSIYFLPPNAMRLSGKTAYIGNMFTYREYRRIGIATKLFALSVDSARELGCSEICLDATEMGRPIYEKYGFKMNEDAMSYFIV